MMRATSDISTSLRTQTITSTGTGVADESTSRLAQELRRRWRAGDRATAEHVLASNPEFAAESEAAVDVVYEEFCLRHEAGEGDEELERDLVRRFPQWAAPLRLMLDCHRRVLQSDRDRPRFPTVGDRLGDFRLRAELGRGARGRVFLATQAALGERPVVLKVTALDGGEHLSLARLQHTNIVPLYSVTDDPARRVRVLCMPYFGRATLAWVLDSLANVPPGERTGRHVLDAIDRAQGGTESSSASFAPVVDGAVRQMLGHVSYAAAMSWVTASLADALQFAHERGLVHLDLKPSNVLLATDGQPLLLDFHLAREPIRTGGPTPEHFGGTPPYMPPEQESAVAALREGRAVTVSVDGRADVYALGAMLYEALGGRLPANVDSKALWRVNPQVSVGLSDLISRCLAMSAEDRYPSAADLAEDLRRHLTDQPLAGVGNRSAAERWQKWRRRRPARLRAALAAAVVIVAGAVVAASVWSRLHDRHERAELALYDAQHLLKAGANHAQAVTTLERGLALVQGAPFEDELRSQLQDQLTAARRLELTDHLHSLGDEVRILYCGVDSIPPNRLRSLAEECAAFWARRDQIIGALGESPPPDVAADLQDVAIFAASLRARLAAAPDVMLDESKAMRQEASRTLDEARVLFGPSAVLDYELQLLNEDPRGPASAPSRIETRPARTAWEHYALGRALIASENLPDAERELRAALRLDPAGRWPNFYYGLCSYRLGRHDDAVAAFSVCIGTAPDVAGCYYNRALALAGANRLEEALRDYDHALRLDPAHAPSALNRGMLHLRGKLFAQAEADLRLALSNGADPATAYYDLSLIDLARNDRDAALADVRKAIEHNPAHDSARRLLETLRSESPMSDSRTSER